MSNQVVVWSKRAEDKTREKGEAQAADAAVKRRASGQAMGGWQGWRNTGGRLRMGKAEKQI